MWIGGSTLSSLCTFHVFFVGKVQSRRLHPDLLFRPCCVPCIPTPCVLTVSTHLPQKKSSCQCTTTSIGDKGNADICLWNSVSVAAYVARFPEGHWSLLGLRPDQNWFATLPRTPDGSWNRVAERMLITLRESGHPFFQMSEYFFPMSSQCMRSGRRSILLQRGTDNCRVVSTDHYLRQSVQYPRSQSGLVRRTCSTNCSSFSK